MVCEVLILIKQYKQTEKEKQYEFCLKAALWKEKREKAILNS